MATRRRVDGRPESVPTVLVVGAGRRGAERAAAVAATGRLRLIAIHDRDPARAAIVATRHGAVALADLDSGLDSRGVDLVIVTTPTGDQGATIARALTAGKRVLAEAPIATRPRAAHLLAKRAARAQLGLAIGSPGRFEPPIRDALALVQGWAIGRVESVRVEVGHRASLHFLQSWRTDVARSGGGCLSQHGPAGCDLIRQFLGEVVLAKGFVRQDIRLPPGCESAAFALFRNHDNAFAELHASWNLPRPGLRAEVRGEGGWLAVETNPPRLSGRLGDGRKLDRRYRAERVVERIHRTRFGCRRAIVAELNAFVSDQNGLGMVATGWDGSRVVEMIRAVYASDRTGDEIPIQPSLVQIPLGAGR